MLLLLTCLSLASASDMASDVASARSSNTLPPLQEIEAYKLDCGQSEQKAVLGQSYTMWCQSSQVTFTACSWQAKGGQLLVAPNVIGTITTGYDGFYNETYCELTITSLNPADVATWSTVTAVDQTPLKLLNAMSVRTDLSKPVPNIRLPTDLKPLSYDIKLSPDLQNFTFLGEVTIEFKVLQDTDLIVLHAGQDMAVSVPRISSASATGIGYDDERQFYMITLGSQLAIGSTFTLTVGFRGVINDDLVGFYKSSYTDPATGKDVFLATTQFQPVDARRAFPCLDEPGMKARFTLSISHSLDQSAVSNMPASGPDLGVTGQAGRVWTRFQETPLMPTYLLAYLVSDFRESQAPQQDGSSGATFGIWAQPSQYNNTEYAALIGPQVLAYFEQKFNLSYPLPKQDMAAVPDIQFGAMENWGLIIYRESGLLYEPGVSSLQSKEWVQILVVHELAHQWFGNLVTMEWWTDLWLNEGFASYMENLGVDLLNPDAKKGDRFIQDNTHPAFRSDGVSTSHSVSVVIEHPSEISENFDDITYFKGAALVRMMAGFMGDDTFFDGIRVYLRKYQYANAKQDQLWAELTKVAQRDSILPQGVTIKNIMDTWTLQSNFPVLNVNRSGSTVLLTQQICLESPPAAKQQYAWHIPINYAEASGCGDFQDTRAKTWLSPADSVKVLALDPSLSDEVLIFNIRQTGFYRVNYDADSWAGIQKALRQNHESIGEVNRAALLDDAFSLAKIAMADYSVPLNMLSYLQQEQAYLPLTTAAQSLDYLSQMLQIRPVLGSFQAKVRGLFAPTLQRLGLDPRPDESYLTAKLRRDVMGLMCALGDRQCVDKSVAAFAAWMAVDDPDANNPIDAEYKELVYCDALHSGGVREWEFLWQRYLRATNSEEKPVMIRSLGCTREPWLLEKLLDMTLEKDGAIKSQDASSVWSGVTTSTLGRFVAWSELKNAFAAINKKYGGSAFAMVGTFVDYAVGWSNTQTALDELMAFQQKHQDELAGSKRTVAGVVEKVGNNVRWMKNNYANIKEWAETK